MFKNLKLRGRIFLGFSIPVVLIFGFTGLAYSIGNKVSEQLKQVSRAQGAIITTDEMILSTSMMARQVRGYLLVKSEEPINEFQKQKQRYQQAAEAADKLIIEPEQRESFKKMLQLGEEYDAMCRKTFALAQQGKQQEAVNLYLRESKKLVGTLDALNE